MSIKATRSDPEHLPCAIILDHHPHDSRTDISEDQQAVQTLTSRMGTGGGNVPLIAEPIVLEGNGARPSHNDVTYVVRRLTPTECARLQGFPDWWCADVPHADSAEYKMWGNGVSLPCVLYVMEGIAKTLRKEEGEQNRIPDNSGNEGDNTA